MHRGSSLLSLKISHSKELLRDTGIGCMVNDASLWRLSSRPGVVWCASALALNWRGAVAVDDGPIPAIAHRAASLPFAGLKAGAYLARGQALAVEIVRVHPKSPRSTVIPVAFALADRGIDVLASLGGFYPRRS